MQVLCDKNADPNKRLSLQFVGYPFPRQNILHPARSKDSYMLALFAYCRPHEAYTSLASLQKETDMMMTRAKENALFLFAVPSLIDPEDDRSESYASLTPLLRYSELHYLDWDARVNADTGQITSANDGNAAGNQPTTVFHSYGHWKWPVRGILCRAIAKSTGGFFDWTAPAPWADSTAAACLECIDTAVNMDRTFNGEENADADAMQVDTPAPPNILPDRLKMLFHWWIYLEWMFKLNLFVACGVTHEAVDPFTFITQRFTALCVDANNAEAKAAWKHTDSVLFDALTQEQQQQQPHSVETVMALAVGNFWLDGFFPQQLDEEHRKIAEDILNWAFHVHSTARLAAVWHQKNTLLCFLVRKVQQFTLNYESPLRVFNAETVVFNQLQRDFGIFVRTCSQPLDAELPTVVADTEKLVMSMHRLYRMRNRTVWHPDSLHPFWLLRPHYLTLWLLWQGLLPVDSSSQQCNSYIHRVPDDILERWTAPESRIRSGGEVMFPFGGSFRHLYDSKQKSLFHNAEWIPETVYNDLCGILNKFDATFVGQQHGPALAVCLSGVAGLFTQKVLDLTDASKPLSYEFLEAFRIDSTVASMAIVLSGSPDRDDKLISALLAWVLQVDFARHHSDGKSIIFALNQFNQPLSLYQRFLIYLCQGYPLHKNIDRFLQHTPPVELNPTERIAKSITSLTQHLAVECYRSRPSPLQLSLFDGNHHAAQFVRTLFLSLNVEMRTMAFRDWNAEVKNRRELPHTFVDVTPGNNGLAEWSMKILADQHKPDRKLFLDYHYHHLPPDNAAAVAVNPLWILRVLTDEEFVGSVPAKMLEIRVIVDNRGLLEPHHQQQQQQQQPESTEVPAITYDTSNDFSLDGFLEQLGVAKQKQATVPMDVDSVSPLLQTSASLNERIKKMTNARVLLAHLAARSVLVD